MHWLRGVSKHAKICTSSRIVPNRTHINYPSRQKHLLLEVCYDLWCPFPAVQYRYHSSCLISLRTGCIAPLFLRHRETI